MNYKQVIKLIGKKNIKKFESWMHGQTCGLIDGEIDYYDHDVADFVRMLKSGKDRQQDKYLWD